MNNLFVQAPKVAVGKDMISAFLRSIENYIPTCAGLTLEEEGGVSEVSYKNLKKLIEKFGKPAKVERKHNGNVLVYFPGKTLAEDKYYLATGFEVGYLGSGPYFFGRFGEDAGFGPCEELYPQLSVMDRNFSGTIWER